MKTKLIILAMCLLVSGCMQGLSPRAELKYTTMTFTRVVNSLAILKEAGKFSEDDIAKMVVFMDSGYALLEEWNKAVKSGTRSPSTIDAVNIVIENLIRYKLEGEENG